MVLSPMRNPASGKMPSGGVGLLSGRSRILLPNTSAVSSGGLVSEVRPRAILLAPHITFPRSLTTRISPSSWATRRTVLP
jgi:hypothetical protein